MPSPTATNSIDLTAAVVPEDLRLKFVQIIHRHGERTPIRSYLPAFVSPRWQLCHYASHFNVVLSAMSEKDNLGPHAPGDFPRRVGPVERRMEDSNQPLADDVSPPAAGQCQFGQLTDKGRHSLFQLGQNLRRLYVDQMHFLPPEFDDENSRQFYFRTTDYPRTLESLQHLLGGLYPTENRQNAKQPPILHTRFDEHETMYADSRCKRWHDLLHQFKQSYKQRAAGKIELLNKRFDRFLAHPTSTPSLYALFDTFTSLHAHGLPLPAGARPEDLRELEEYSHQMWFAGFDQSRQFIRLGTGKLLRELRGELENAAADSENRRLLSIFSGHDSTLAPLLCAFRVSDGRWPPFSSNIIFELFQRRPEQKQKEQSKQQREYFVRMKYMLRPVEVPECAAPGNHYPGDPTICTIDAFMRSFEDVLDRDHDQECKE